MTRVKPGTPIKQKLPSEYNKEHVERIDILSDYPYKQVGGVKNRTYIKKVITGTFYQDLKQQHPELAQYTNGQIRKYLLVFNKKIADTVVNNRDGVELPEHLGHIFVGCMKRVNPPIDWELSNKLGHIIYHRGLASMGYTFCTFYVHSLEKYNFVNHDIWRFEPTYTLKSRIGKRFKLSWKDYITIPSMKHVEGYIKTFWNKWRADRRNREEIRNYNEFEGLI